MLSWLTGSNSHVVLPTESTAESADTHMDDATRKRAADSGGHSSASISASPTPERKKARATTQDEAVTPTGARAAAAEEETEALLQRLKSEMDIKEPLNYVAAARDMLLQPQASFHSLRAVHDLPHSRAAFTSVVSILKRLALHQPPVCALRLDKPTDAALLSNLQMLLQTSTANGGASSRPSCR